MPSFFSKRSPESEPLIRKERKTSDVLPCVIATAIACQLSFLTGVSMGYSAILLAQLELPTSVLRINVNQASWIASLGVICRPIGALVEGVVVDVYGRKTTMQIVAILIAISWLITYFSYNIPLLYFSRTLLSFALGELTLFLIDYIVFLSAYLGMVICVGLYIAEISKPSDRGTLLSLITPMTIGGTLFVYVLGYFFTWETVALILCGYSLIIFALTCYLPESPIWYMIKSNKTKAVQALLWCRNDKSEVVEKEITDIEDRLRKIETKPRYFENFKDPAVWKPFIIIVIFSIFQQQVGYNIITYYAVDFFSSFETKYDGTVLSIIFAAISTVGSLLLMTVVHKFNRKTLLSASGLGMTIAMTLGAICLMTDSHRRLSVLPVICVFVYILFCMIGMIDIPWMMIGEMFPSRVRGTMSANVTVIIFIITFFNVKLYPLLNHVIGVLGIFWYFAFFSLLTVIFAKIFFPETRNKSLFDIEDGFRKNGAK